MKDKRKRDYHRLVEFAKRAKRRAYAPYSNFRVGAAIRTKSGKIYTGCNIESSSYGLTICAERTAIFKAISEGEKNFVAVAVVSDDSTFCPPCGACRQVLMDLAPQIEFVLVDKKGKEIVVPINHLFPLPFGPKYLLRRK
jgi:cytidine deaminase